jgi:hypothetical protein
MGPLRRQLIAIFLLPSQALAEVCDKEREDWNGERIGWLNQALDFQISGEIVVIATLTLLICVPGIRRWLAWVFAFGFTVGFLGYLDQRLDFINEAARREGCLGPLSADLALPIALMAITLSRLWFLHRKPTNEVG